MQIIVFQLPVTLNLYGFFSREYQERMREILDHASSQIDTNLRKQVNNENE